MTIGALRRICKLWQKRLRITDWTVSIRWSVEGELPNEYGTAEYDPRQMLAEIVVRPVIQQQDYADGGIEQTVIHELLHLVLHGDTDYEKENIMQERSINQIADALYWAYRPKKKNK